MALTQVTGPYPIFTDLDGTPLDDGYLYIGAINQDPEQNPIQVFWDANLTIPATQPIRTSNGYAYRNGTPALLYTAGAFSITIRNKRDEFVLYSPVGYGFDPAAVSASVVKNDFIGDGVRVAFGLTAAPSTILATNAFINGVYQEKDSYTVVGNTLTFSIAPPLNSSIEVMTNETGVINSGNATAISYTAGFSGAIAQTVQTKLQQYVSVEDFGAVGNGVTDDTVAIQAAVNAMTEGGQLFFPPGKYKLTNEITLPSVGSLTLQGSGGVDFIRGSPVPSGSGTYLFQTTANKAIFVFSPGCSYSSVKDMSFSPALVPSATPELTGKLGIKIQGDLPNVIWSLNFERLFFYNLEYGIVAQDTTSGSTGQDYSIAPCSVRQCFFVECFNGVYIDTNNADMWSYEQSFFFVPPNGNGVYLRRFGLQHFTNCSSGGTSISANRFVNIQGVGTNSVDKILFTNCQCETLTQFVNVQTGGGYADPFDIEMHSCVAELGADVYLGGKVNFISINSRYSSANINVDNAAVKLTTINDTFAASDIYFLSGTANTSFQNTMWGQGPSAIYGKRRYEDGVLVKLTGTEAGVISGVATNLFLLPVTAGLYEVYVYLASAGSGSLYMASSRVGADGGEVARIGGESGANMAITVASNYVRATQTSGTNQTVSWGYRKLT